MPLFDLPYDIRHHIYSHLFPREKHLYLHATDVNIAHLPAQGCKIPISLLQTCRDLKQEVSEYLYNGYLFDVVGRKQDCLRNYGQLHETIEKYARSEVHLRVLTNGPKAATGCISIFVGDANLAVANGRYRGELTTLEGLDQEVKLRPVERRRPFAQYWPAQSQAQMYRWTYRTAVAALVLLLAWVTERAFT